jgi:hypothetical protein
MDKGMNLQAFYNLGNTKAKNPSCYSKQYNKTQAGG